MPSSVTEPNRPDCDPGTSSTACAFEAFLHAESDALVIYLRRKQVEPEDACELAQEAQMRLLRYRDQPREVLRPLLYRIALNLLRDHWRQRAGVREGLGRAQPLDPDILIADTPGPEQMADQQQELMRVRRAIGALPAHCRSVYLLNRIDNMSYPQIARHMGVSVKAVEKQISKALALLRLSMARDSGS